MHFDRPDGFQKVVPAPGWCLPGCFGSHPFPPGQSAAPDRASVPRADQRSGNVWIPSSHRVRSLLPGTFPDGKGTILSGGQPPPFWEAFPFQVSGDQVFHMRCRTFCLGDDPHADIPVPVKIPQFVKSRNRKEIPVQQEQGIPKGKGGMVSIFHHLYYMGSARNSRTVPGPGSLQAIMEPDA